MNCNKCPLQEECDDAKEMIVEYYGKNFTIAVLDMLSDFCPIVHGGDIKAIFEKEVNDYFEV